MKLTKKVEETMTEKMKELKTVVFLDLVQFAESSTKEIVIDNKKFEYTIWRTLVNEGEVRIVLQIDRGSFLGLASLAACGFAKDSNNQIRDLA